MPRAVRARLVGLPAGRRTRAVLAQLVGLPAGRRATLRTRVAPCLAPHALRCS